MDANDERVSFNSEPIKILLKALNGLLYIPFL
jgi:hypothetical protein